MKTKWQWHRTCHASKPRNYRKSKLHIAVELESGCYRALCRRDVLLVDNPYPKSMLETAIEEGRLCKICLHEMELQRYDNR